MGHFPTTNKVDSKVWASIVSDSRDEYDAVSSCVLVSSRDVTGRVSKEVREDAAAAASTKNTNNNNSTNSSNTNATNATTNEQSNGSKGTSKPLSSDTAGAIFQYMLK